MNKPNEHERNKLLRELEKAREKVRILETRLACHSERDSDAALQNDADLSLKEIGINDDNYHLFPAEVQERFFAQNDE